MKKYLWISLVCISFCCSIKAQIYEPINYKTTIFCDGLPQNLIPDIFNEVYYSKLKQSDIKGKRIVDDTHRKTDVYLRSKKARNGFLYVNKDITDYIEVEELDNDLERIKVEYVYNKKNVTTEEDVIQFLKLKKRKIEVICLSIDKPSGIITAYITGK